MPFKVHKVDGGYKVSSPKGDKSKHPMSKEKARAQQAAIYANWDGKEEQSHDEVTGLPLNKDGTVTVYHHTSAAKAAQIKATGILKAAGEPHVYVTTQQKNDTGYGDTAVPIMINPALLMLDDEFPDGRQDFRISVGKPGGSIRVKVGDIPKQNVMESLRHELTSIFFEGTVKLPIAEIEVWLKSHIDEIVAKLKETATQGYQTYADDGITITNPYTNEPMDVTLYINKKLTIPDNDTVDPILYYDSKTTAIHLNAQLILSLYKSKNTLYAALLKGIVHEMTHAIDPGRPHKKNEYDSYEEYINNSVEFPAFANMYLNKLKNKIQSGKLQVDVLADAIRSGKKIPDIEVGGFMNKLNPENRTKFINYIYKELIA